MLTLNGVACDAVVEPVGQGDEEKDGDDEEKDDDALLISPTNCHLIHSQLADFDDDVDDR